MSDLFAPLQQELSKICFIQRVGRLTSLQAGMIRVGGLIDAVSLGDRVQIAHKHDKMGAEVVALHNNEVILLPEGEVDGLAINDLVIPQGPLTLAPDRTWLGRVINPLGEPLDGGPPLREGPHKRRLALPPPAAASRRRLGKRLDTGKAVLNTILPLVQGQRIGLFSGSGVGKSMLLGELACKVDVDVVVIALVGERGRELREFTETVLGPKGLERSVVVTATSDQSPLMRRRCALSAMSVAEYFRDQGAHVLLLMDSVTRFAEAHREISLSTGEPASLRGYPPSLQHSLMALAERAGPGANGQGDITAIFTVLVAGSDMEEPVADIMRGVLDGHVVMDRAIAEKGRFPAIDVLRSVSRALPSAASDVENKIITEARRVLGTWDKAEMMVQAGLYQKGSDPEIDRAIRIVPMLESFLAENANGIEDSFKRLAQCLNLGR